MKQLPCVEAGFCSRVRVGVADAGLEPPRRRGDLDVVPHANVPMWSAPDLQGDADAQHTWTADFPIRSASLQSWGVGERGAMDGMLGAGGEEESGEEEVTALPRYTR
jgi:hypothetical protein